MRHKVNGKAVRRKKSPAGGLSWLFPKLSNPKRRFGVGVALALAAKDGKTTKLRYAALEAAFERPGQKPKAAVLARADADLLASTLAGLAHVDRIRVASAIMTGSNSHALLKRALGLKTGPLYHHIRGLRMAGLVTLLDRNCYALTELGESALLVATGLGLPMNGSRSFWKRRSL